MLTEAVTDVARIADSTDSTAHCVVLERSRIELVSAGSGEQHLLSFDVLFLAVLLNFNANYFVTVSDDGPTGVESMVRMPRFSTAPFKRSKRQSPLPFLRASFLTANTISLDGVGTFGGFEAGIPVNEHADVITKACGANRGVRRFLCKMHREVVHPFQRGNTDSFRPGTCGPD